MNDIWMNHNDIAPRNGVRHLGIQAPHVSLYSIGKLFVDANELTLLHPASLSMVDSSLTSPIINLRHLIIHDVAPGLELRFDGTMLPRLRSLRTLIVPLFIAFMRRANQMKILDTVDHLVITDQSDNAGRCFSFKQWYIVLDVLPRLRRLLIQFNTQQYLPMAVADLLVDYMKRTTRTPLTLSSCCLDHCSDEDDKEHFIVYLI